ncbi:NRDE family protein [uncultured Gammaproteobacteria bacterium]
MCTMVILRRPAAAWPLIIGANRDEMLDRPWLPPGRHWPERPGVTAGLDQLGLGTWLGINHAGVVAGILNREGTLGPAVGLRSRGELVLAALGHPDALAAAEAMATIDPRDYRPFNLVIADREHAFCLYHRSTQRPHLTAESIGAGLSMITAHDLNDRNDSRIRLYLPQFEEATQPEPERDDWREWEDLLASHLWVDDAGPKGAMCFSTPSGFGTGSGSLIAVAGSPESKPSALWRFAAGPPGRVPWRDVVLG